MRFNGPEYQTGADHKRLTKQHDIILALMIDGKWRTLNQIAEITNQPQASVSAQLRHLRKPRFGSYTVERRPSGNRDFGLFEYRVKPNVEMLKGRTVRDGAGNN